MMKKLLILTIALLSFNFAFAQQLPSVSVEQQNGESINVTSLIDGETPMIVSFWSTTCKPCIKELDAIYEAMPDWLDETDFRMVAVSIDDARSVARARSMAEARGWASDFTALYDINQDFKRALNVNLTPQVFIFDKDGNQVYSHTGYLPGSESELIEKLIEISE